jgi:DNA-binding XRE family transcriptional regulator
VIAIRFVPGIASRDIAVGEVMPRSAPDAARAALTKDLRRQVGRWLKDARESARLTQAELAERVGLRYYTFVSQVESGVGRVPVDLQEAWATTLGLDPCDFARHLLRFYEPELHRLLFSDDLGGRRVAGSAS